MLTIIFGARLHTGFIKITIPIQGDREARHPPPFSSTRWKMDWIPLVVIYLNRDGVYVVRFRR